MQPNHIPSVNAAIFPITQQYAIITKKYIEVESMGKGNVIVGQSGGPTSVINSSLAGVFAAAKENGADKVYGMLHGVEGLLSSNYIDMSDYVKDTLDIELLRRTPSSFLGSCRHKLPAVDTDESKYVTVFELLKKLDIKYFFYIGGNDSMDTIKKLSDYAKAKGVDIGFMGVPKTIDNDLAVTDHTPGYGSASKYIAASVREVIRDSYAYDQKMVTVVEIMGRNAGWLTAASALAASDDCTGPDMIFVPEVPFELDSFLDKVNEGQKNHKSFVVAVSEGLKTTEGKYVAELSADGLMEDAFGHKALSGTAGFLTRYIQKNIGCKTRSIEFSSLQRCAAHMASRTDNEEAFLTGGKAVKAAFAGESGKMIIITRTSDSPYHVIAESCDIARIANIEKMIPREWLSADGTCVTQDFLNYARPLIQGEINPVMVGGLPKHLVIKK